MKDKNWKIIAIVSTCLLVVVIATSAYTSYSYEYTLKDVCDSLSGIKTQLSNINENLSDIEQELYYTRRGDNSYMTIKTSF